MRQRKILTSLAICTLLTSLGACNMYVIDFENKLPNGTVLAPKAEIPPPPPPEPVEPIEGSLEVAFMDSTTAQLEGCRVITGMRILHDGSFDDGLIKLRNTAVRINANRIIPLHFAESPVNGTPHRFSAKMVRCPDPKPEADNG
ncbi:MAG: hypothetical protein VXW17_01875 [Pseudomonadota bacterium]|nr:hypothetical protein [Pseudomonadota bacterium]MEC7236746.1 hypothetical protein [Pseudomonadota bacterium]